MAIAYSNCHSREKGNGGCYRQSESGSVPRRVNGGGRFLAGNYHPAPAKGRRIGPVGNAGQGQAGIDYYRYAATLKRVDIADEPYKKSESANSSP